MGLSGQYDMIPLDIALLGVSLSIAKRKHGRSMMQTVKPGLAVSGTHRRIEWIDVAKGIAMILVFYGHLSGSGDNPWFPDLTISRTVVYYFHMPLFFVLSGLTLNLGGEFRVFAGKRVRRLIVPYYFFSLYVLGKIVLRILSPSAFDAFHAQGMQSVSHELATVLLGNAEGLWFFWALFWGDLLLWALNRFFGRGGLFAIVPIGLLGWYAAIVFSISLPFQFQTIAEAAAFTAAGILVSPIIQSLRTHDVIAPFMISILVFSVSAALLLGIGSDNVFGRLLPVLFAAVSGSLMIIFLSRWFRPFDWLTFIGRNTIVFYGLNGLSLAVAKYLFFRAFSVGQISSNLLLQLLAGMVIIAVACTICFVACLVINRWLWWTIGSKPAKKRKRTHGESHLERSNAARVDAGEITPE
jgi:fucose 4-O-acetylase-like acetyltransferase